MHMVGSDIVSVFQVTSKLFLIWFYGVGICEEPIDLNGANIGGVIYGDASLVSVDSQMITTSVVGDYVLCQNFPNPFNPSTTIKYELPKASQVSLTVYDVLGRGVSVLVNERTDAGVHEVKFGGSGLSSGVYFYRIQAGSFVQTRKLSLLK